MENDILVTIILAIFASSGFWAFLQTAYMNRRKRASAEQRLLLGLAFREIIAACQGYIAAGEISAEEYKEIKHYLFTPYAEMGGDGTAERLIKEVEKLPIKREAHQ